MAMMLRRLGLINKNQLGFTLIELVLAFTISAVVTGAITVTLHQMMTGNLRTSNHMSAVRQVQDAGYWVSHDTHMAQSVNTDDDPATSDVIEILTLTWSSWASGSTASKEHQAVYTLEGMPSGSLKNLVRTHDDGTDKTMSVIAQFIDPDPEQTSCVWDDGVLTFTVTAIVGTGSGEQPETRTYEVIPRSAQQ